MKLLIGKRVDISILLRRFRKEEIKWIGSSTNNFELFVRHRFDSYNCTKNIRELTAILLENICAKNNFNCSLFIGWIAKWLNAADCKSVPYGSGVQIPLHPFIFMRGSSRWLARQSHKLKVVGSSPIPAIIICRDDEIGRHASLRHWCSCGVRVRVPLSV